MLMLECVAEGNPTPTVTWLLNRVPVNLTDNSFQLLDNNSLLVSEASQDTVGLYTCIAENGFATSSASAQVDVVPASSLLTSPFQNTGKTLPPLALSHI